MTFWAPSSQHGGYLHLIPMRLEQALTATKIAMWMDGQTPAAGCIIGDAGDGTRSAALWFERATEFSLPTGKHAAERVHLQKFRSDHQARAAGDPFVRARPSRNDPPDFVCTTTAGEEVALECVTFADERRRAAAAQMRPLEERLRELGRGALSHLEGCVVYVYFGEGGDLTPPRPRSANDEFDALANAVRALEVNRRALWQSGGQLPTPAPDIGQGATAFGDRAHAVPTNDGHRPSRFMRQVGFDLTLACSFHYTVDELRSKLSSIVETKDRPENRWLLITAGGPDHRGLTYPGEEFLAGLLVDEGLALPAPNHLERVVLHRWGSGDAWELYPKFTEIVPPARPGLPGELSYSMPALPVELAPRRNAPCPCGSGRKYKACHGAT